MESRIRKADRFFWHPFTQMKFHEKVKPPVIVEARGCWLYDTEGRKYLDGVSSLWCIVHGHSHPKLVEAIKRQADKLQHSTTLGLINVPSALLAEKLAKLTRMDKVFFSEDGAEAVEVALKIVSQIVPRGTFMSLKGAYHGDTIGAVSIGGLEAFHGVFRSLTFKTLFAPSVYCFRCPWNRGKTTEERKCSEECLKSAIKMLGEKVKAVILEGGVQAAGGICPYPQGYISKMREETSKRNIMLIVDEIATGFGRTGKMFGCEHENVKPDIMCIGKGLSAGYLPLAATLTRNSIYEAFLGELWEGKHFFHGHTFTGNPILTRVALANLEIFEEERTLEKLPEKIKHLWRGLETLWGRKYVGDIRGKGFMVGIELTEDKISKKPFPQQALAGWRVCLKALERGVFLRPLGDVVVIIPPLSISLEEIDFLVNVLSESLKALQA